MTEEITIKTFVITLDVIHYNFDFYSFCDYIKANVKKDFIFINAVDFAESTGRTSRSEARGQVKSKGSGVSSIVKGIKTKIETETQKYLDSKKKHLAQIEKQKQKEKSKPSKHSSSSKLSNTQEGSQPLYDGEADLVFCIYNFPYLEKQLRALVQASIPFDGFISLVNLNSQTLPFSQNQQSQQPQQILTGDALNESLPTSVENDELSQSLNPYKDEESVRSKKVSKSTPPPAKKVVPGQELDCYFNPGVVPPLRWIKLREEAPTSIFFDQVPAPPTIEESWNVLQKEIGRLLRCTKEFSSIFLNKTFISVPHSKATPDLLDHQDIVQNIHDPLSAMLFTLKSHEWKTPTSSHIPEYSEIFDKSVNIFTKQIMRPVVFQPPESKPIPFIQCPYPVQLYHILYPLLHWKIEKDKSIVTKAVSAFYSDYSQFNAVAGHRFDTMINGLNKRLMIGLPTAFFDWMKWKYSREISNILEDDDFSNATKNNLICEKYLEESAGLLWVMFLPPIIKSIGKPIKDFYMPPLLDGTTEWLDYIFEAPPINDKRAKKNSLTPVSILKSKDNILKLLPALNDRLQAESVTQIYKLPAKISHSECYASPYYFESGLCVQIMRNVLNESFTFGYKVYYTDSENIQATIISTSENVSLFSGDDKVHLDDGMTLTYDKYSMYFDGEKLILRQENKIRKKKPKDQNSVPAKKKPKLDHPLIRTSSSNFGHKLPSSKEIINNHNAEESKKDDKLKNKDKEKEKEKEREKEKENEKLKEMERKKENEKQLEEKKAKHSETIIIDLNGNLFYEDRILKANGYSAQKVMKKWIWTTPKGTSIEKQKTAATPQQSATLIDAVNLITRVFRDDGLLYYQNSHERIIKLSDDFEVIQNESEVIFKIKGFPTIYYSIQQKKILFSTKTITYELDQDIYLKNAYFSGLYSLTDKEFHVQFYNNSKPPKKSSENESTNENYNNSSVNNDNPQCSDDYYSETAETHNINNNSDSHNDKEINDNDTEIEEESSYEEENDVIFCKTNEIQAKSKTLILYANSSGVERIGTLSSKELPVKKKDDAVTTKWGRIDPIKELLTEVQQNQLTRKFRPRFFVVRPDLSATEFIHQDNLEDFKLKNNYIEKCNEFEIDLNDNIGTNNNNQDKQGNENGDSKKKLTIYSLHKMKEKPLAYIQNAVLDRQTRVTLLRSLQIPKARKGKVEPNLDEILDEAQIAHNNFLNSFSILFNLISEKLDGINDAFIDENTPIPPPPPPKLYFPPCEPPPRVQIMMNQKHFEERFLQSNTDTYWDSPEGRFAEPLDLPRVLPKPLASHTSMFDPPHPELSHKDAPPPDVDIETFISEARNKGSLDKNGKNEKGTVPQLVIPKQLATPMYRTEVSRPQTATAKTQRTSRSSDRFDFGIIPIKKVSIKSIHITNTGSKPMHYGIEPPRDKQIKVLTLSGVVMPGLKLVLKVSITPEVEGVIQSQVTVVMKDSKLSFPITAVCKQMTK